MDITTVFGTVVPGSNPGGSTKNVSVAKIFCASTASRLREMRQDSNAAVMYCFCCLPDKNNTDEAGSRVLMSNPHKVWLAQLVTRDRVLVSNL